MQTIKPGDAACLVDASDPLTPEEVEFLVLEVNGNMARCTWDEDHGNVHCEQWIPVALLRKST